MSGCREGLGKNLLKYFQTILQKLCKNSKLYPDMIITLHNTKTKECNKDNIIVFIIGIFIKLYLESDSDPNTNLIANRLIEEH